MAGTKDETPKVLEKIAAWPDEKRPIGERLHQIVTSAVPELRPKLYYGQPGYGLGGPVLVFFRCDDGLVSMGVTEKSGYSRTDALVATGWFVNDLDEAAEKRIAEVAREAAR